MRTTETMLTRTRRLLAKRDQTGVELSMTAIAAEADVGFEWLRKMASGELVDPGSEKVERVHDVLTQRFPLRDVFPEMARPKRARRAA